MKKKRKYYTSYPNILEDENWLRSRGMFLSNVHIYVFKGETRSPINIIEDIYIWNWTKKH